MARPMTLLTTVLVGSGLLSACVITPAPLPSPITLELVNTTGLDVRPGAYISGSAADQNTLFVGPNLITVFTDRPFPELRPAETVTLTYECDGARSLGVKQPVMFDALTLETTRSDDQAFLLRGSDFDCGATVRFVYYTEGAAFRVRVEIE